MLTAVASNYFRLVCECSLRVVVMVVILFTGLCAVHDVQSFACTISLIEHVCVMAVDRMWLILMLLSMSRLSSRCVTFATGLCKVGKVSV